MGSYLTAPNKEKHFVEGTSRSFDFAAAEMQGWRITMEDAVITSPEFDTDISLFAIFDGHGGSEVAKFCAKHFGTVLKKNENYVKRKYKIALEESFMAMDDKIREIEEEDEDYDDIKDTHAGCTALVCLMVGKRLYVANAGDCRCLIFADNGEIFQMNREHKPTDREEFDRIKQAGGFVIGGRVNENLNLSRAIGDLGFKDNPTIDQKDQLISAFPDVVEKDIGELDVCILMGCDGVFERLSDHMLKEVVFRGLKEDKELKEVLSVMLDDCLGNKLMGVTGLDNMSSILVAFKE